MPVQFNRQRRRRHPRLALEPFQELGLDEPLLDLLIEEHETVTLPRLQRLWRYFRNPLAEPNDHEIGRAHV